MLHGRASPDLKVKKVGMMTEMGGCVGGCNFGMIYGVQMYNSIFQE